MKITVSLALTARTIDTETSGAMRAKAAACMPATTGFRPAAATATRSARSSVEWRHDGSAYHFTPRGEARDGCRYATMVVDGRKPHDVLACPAGRGDWTFRRT